MEAEVDAHSPEKKRDDATADTTTTTTVPTTTVPTANTTEEDGTERGALSPPPTSIAPEENDASVDVRNGNNRRSTGDDATEEPSLTRNAPCDRDNPVSDTRNAEDDESRLVQLTRDLVTIVKSSSRGVTLEEIGRRLPDLPPDGGWARDDDVATVCECLEGVGLLRVDAGSQSGAASVEKVLSWWDTVATAATDGAGVSFASMRDKMTLLVREEAKLDVWLSRLRNLQPVTATDEVYVTPADIHRSVGNSRDRWNEGIEASGEVRRKQPLVVIHAPFGSSVQVFQPMGTKEGTCDGECNEDEQDAPVSSSLGKRTTSQLLVSSKRRVIQNHVNESDPPAQKSLLGRETTGTQPPAQVRVYFLSEHEGNVRLRGLHDDPVMRLIEEPAYVTMEVQRRLTESSGDDRFHVSCLKATEGASSFF